MSGAPVLPGLGVSGATPVPPDTGEGIGGAASSFAPLAPLVDDPIIPAFSISGDDKLSFIMTNMGTKAAITNSQVQIMRATKALIGQSETKIRNEMQEQISKAVDPLKDEMSDLRNKISQLETTSSSSNSGMTKETMSLLNSFDPALRRVAFIGFKLGTSETDRTIDLQRWASSVGNFGEYQTGHFYNGPRNNKILSVASYMEYHSEMMAQNFIIAAKDKQFCLTTGEKVKVKIAVTKINSSRNWALRKAEDLIKSDSVTGNRVLKTDWKNRTITVGGNIVFNQCPTDLKGSFVDEYVHLKFP